MTHPNDMTHWDEIRCQRGCESHPTRVETIHLGPHGYPDYPAIPERFHMSFDFEIWDTDQTPVDHGPYCPARDALSETILSHRVWEPVETIVMLDCFDRFAECLFVDIGAQIGWYSTLAMLQGAHPFVVECDMDAMGVLARNVSRYMPLPSLGDDHPYFWGLTTHRVGQQDTCDHGYGGLPLWPEPDWKERTGGEIVAKIDVEGAEPDAVDLLDFWFGLPNVSAMLIEVSPVFHDRYPALVRDIMDAGFVAGILPEKRPRPTPLNSISDLTWMTDGRALAAWVETWHQKNVLFAREDLV